jgi:DNA-binding CsgD family transcriptional regulator
MRKLIELGWGTSNRAFRQVFATQFLPDGSQEMIEEFDALQRHSSEVGDAVRMLDVAVQTDITEQARHVKCPTLVLHGDEDARIPFEEGRILASLIPGARFVGLKSRNHILLRDEPAWPRFLEELDAFLPDDGPAETITGLTTRERETLEFVAQGLDNHQIAAHLGLSEKTVRNMVSNILDKLEVESRSAAIVRARTAGFGTSVPGQL